MWRSDTRSPRPPAKNGSHRTAAGQRGSGCKGAQGVGFEFLLVANYCSEFCQFSSFSVQDTGGQTPAVAGSRLIPTPATSHGWRWGKGSSSEPGHTSERLADLRVVAHAAPQWGSTRREGVFSD
jgi:hypothetical protein